MTTKGPRGRYPAITLLTAGVAALLGGCAGGGASPLGDSLRSALPGLGSGDASERAAALPYASLSFATTAQRGLLVLGAESGAVTVWPTGREGALLLRHEGLGATAGMGQDLLSLRYTAAPRAADSQVDAEPTAFLPWRAETPVNYQVHSQWRLPSGDMLSARGQAELRCAPATAYALPLGEQPLESCVERVRWEGGEQTRSTLYRSPESRRLWAAQLMPWPSGPTFDWEVARAWW